LPVTESEEIKTTAVREHRTKKQQQKKQQKSKENGSAKPFYTQI
jgi:hypothetical protein